MTEDSVLKKKLLAASSKMGPRTDDRRLVPRDKGPRAGRGRVEAKRRDTSKGGERDNASSCRGENNLAGTSSRGMG